jgi:hypothetical protein
MTYTGDYREPSRYPQQPYGQQYRPGQSWWPQLLQPGPGSPQRPRRKSWPDRHKALTGFFALFRHRGAGIRQR